MQFFVVMGVSGCGKTSVGTALSERCGIAFVDGDTLHPRSNIDKMASGQPLTDGDRMPWLADVGRTFARADAPMLIGCSALKRIYRDLIRAEAGAPVHFLHLHAPQEVLEVRVSQRDGHFMPPALLESQFQTLEHLEPDEAGVVIDIDQTLDAVIAQSERYVRETLT